MRKNENKHRKVEGRMRLMQRESTRRNEERHKTKGLCNHCSRIKNKGSICCDYHLGYYNGYRRGQKQQREALLKDVDIPKTFGCNKDLERALCGEISFANRIILCDSCTMDLINKLGEIKQLLKGDKENATPMQKMQ